MVIFLNPDGTAEKVTPEHVYQGSNNVIDITVIAPYSMSTAMQIGFILPNGLYWMSPAPENARYAPMEFVGPSEENGDAGAWNFVLPISVTQQVGEVQVAINAIGTTGNTTSYLCKFTVEESVLPELPETSPEPSVYDLIQQYLARLDGRTANVPNLVADIQKASGNSFTYTDNKGVVSAPIALGVVDYNPTYVGAASVIKLPASAWQPPNPGSSVPTYTLTITAAQHGQMRDGVTADDLLVDFKQEAIGGGSYSGYNASYTISKSGDITVRSNSILNFAIVAIIWNCKGLADITARNEIAAETAVRESADANLQQQIDEIVDSGVDLKARAEIAAEIERAQSAEATLQANITAESNRAQSAEQGLQNAVNTNASNIEELREDVDEIDSYIPSSTSVSNKLTDQDFVNSSINNIAAFYITPTAVGDEAFPTRAALLSATTFYSGGQPRTPTQNDYAIVIADESKPKGVDGSYPTTRYSYQGGTYPNGQWGFQYIVNNTSLTQAQVNAINSGITATSVAQITTNKNNITSEISARESADANLQQQIDEMNESGVYSVNGQTGAVELTAADVEAVSKDGDIMSGKLTLENVSDMSPIEVVKNSGDTYISASRPDVNNTIRFGIGSSGGNRGIWDVKLNKWIFNADISGNVKVNGYVPYSSNNPPKKTGGLVETVDKTTVNTSSFGIGSTITLSNLGFAENQKYIGGMLFIRVGGSTYANGIVAYVNNQNQAIVTYNGGVSLSSSTRRYQSELYYFTVG